MYIKRGAWKKAANLTMQMNVIMLEWGVSNLIGRRSKKLNRMYMARMESLRHDVNWAYIGVGLPKRTQQLLSAKKTDSFMERRGNVSHNSYFFYYFYKFIGGGN